MGRSKSSSQANQTSSNTTHDGRIINESGIVAQNSVLEFDYSTQNNLTSYDLSNRSTNNSWSDNSSTSWNYADNSDRSTNNSWADNSSTAWSYNDGRTTNTSSWDSSQSNSNNVTNTTTNNTTADPAIAKAAFDFAAGNDARNGEGFDKLLDAARELTVKTQDSATSMAARYQGDVMQAIDSARNTTPGGIDNKTMIILGVAGAVAVAAMAGKRG